MFIKRIVPGHFHYLLPIGHRLRIQEILSKAEWSSAQTFAIYYDKNLDTTESSASQFQKAILTL